MNIKQLEIFVLICKYHNLQKVADIMKCKQPTVTFHLRNLEESAGVPLFKQKNKYFTLTDAGEDLLKHAQEILRILENTNRSLLDYQQHQKGTIKIGSSSTPAIYFIPKILVLLLNKYPKVKPFMKVSSNSPQIITLLKEFEIDLGLITETTFLDEELHAIPVINDELGIVMHPDHPFANVDAITLKHLLSTNNTPILLREKESASRKLFDEWTEKNGISFDNFIELGSTEVIKQAVLANMGIAPLSNLAVMNEVKNQQLLFKFIDQKALTRTVYLAYNKKRHLTKILKDYIAIFEEAGRE